MKSNYVMFAAAMIAGIATPLAAAAQYTGHQIDPAPAAALQTAAADCARAQPQLLRTIDGANMRVEAARQSNSPSAMRAAMDDVQGALGSLRAQLAACRELQKASAADPHAGRAMPHMQQAPAASPGTPVMQPGSTAPAPTAPATKMPTADPHAGHTMPPAPAAKRSAPATKPTAPAKKPDDPHAGHKMPAPAKSKVETADKSKAPPGERKPAPDAHAGHTTPETKPAPPSKSTDRGVTRADPKLPVMPAERVADPACPDNVNDPKAPTAVYQRKVYYFCSTEDRDEFRKDPAVYLEKRSR